MKEQIVVEGKTFEGQPVTIVSENSLWSEALLADGTVVRIRPVLSKVLLIPELSEAMKKPIYYIDVGIIKDMSVPAKRDSNAQGGRNPDA